MSIDPKQYSDIERIHRCIQGGNFDERDVKEFLIAIREICPKNSIMRDFCDFIAHREKDRGETVEFVKKVRRQLSEDSNENKIIDIPLISFTKISTAINEILKLDQIRLEELKPERIKQFIVVLASILQNAKIVEKQSKSKDKKYNTTVNIAFGFNAEIVGAYTNFWLGDIAKAVEEKRGLGGTMLPIIAVRNTFFEPINPDYPEIEHFFQGIVKVECRKGKLEYDQTRPPKLPE